MCFKKRHLQRAATNVYVLIYRCTWIDLIKQLWFNLLKIYFLSLKFEFSIVLAKYSS